MQAPLSVCLKLGYGEAVGLLTGVRGGTDLARESHRLKRGRASSGLSPPYSMRAQALDATASRKHRRLVGMACSWRRMAPTPIIRLQACPIALCYSMPPFVTILPQALPGHMLPQKVLGMASGWVAV